MTDYFMMIHQGKAEWKKKQNISDINYRNVIQKNIK